MDETGNSKETIDSQIPNFVVSSKIDIMIKPSPAKTPEIVESAI